MANQTLTLAFMLVKGSKCGLGFVLHLGFAGVSKSLQDYEAFFTRSFSDPIFSLDQMPKRTQTIFTWEECHRNVENQALSIQYNLRSDITHAAEARFNIEHGLPRRPESKVLDIGVISRKPGIRGAR